VLPVEPAVKRTVAFFDGQNLFHGVKEAFGYTFPNYDPVALATAICSEKGWQLDAVRFYTGVPEIRDRPALNTFWNAKLAVLGTRGVVTFSRPLRYQNKTVSLPSGAQHTYLAGHEKGVDIRIALDVIRLILSGDCDVALLFSQDQDFSEVADEARLIATREQRWIKIASAYPSSPTYRNRRGIDKTDWIPFDRALYDRGIDPTDYRPKG
jgi:uncharacterized LabA/DUF88 family protein